MSYHFLLQGIFPTQGSNSNLLHLLHWQAGSFALTPPGNPCNTGDVGQSLGQEDALEKEMEAYSSVLAWEI